MKRIRSPWAILCAALLFAATLPAQAQIDDRAGTAAMEELLVPVTPRTVALSNSLTGGLASMNPVEAVQSNPAALIAGSGTNAMFSRTEYLADIGINYFGVAQTFGNYGIALSVTAWDYGDIPQTDELLNPTVTDLTYEASTLVVGATFSRRFTDRISAGFSVKGLSRSIAEASSNGVAFDAGMTYVVGESGLRFGVSLKNFGTKMQFDGADLGGTTSQTGPDGSVDVPVTINDLEAELPSLLNFGVTYTRQVAQDVNATGMVNFRSNSYDLDEYSGGLELDYRSLVFVRGGYTFTSDVELNAWSDWNIGAGVNLPVANTAVSVDYAYRPSTVFDGVNMFSVALTL